MSALREFLAKYDACQAVSDKLLIAAKRELDDIDIRFRSGASPAYVLDLLGVDLSDVAKRHLNEYKELLVRLQFFRNLSDN